MPADALAVAPAWRNNKHRWLWVPDQRSLCSLVRDDVNFVPEAGSNFQTAETISDTTAHSRGAMRPRFCKNRSPSKTEGAGNAGRSMHPQPRVRNKIKHTSVVTTGPPDSPGIPRAMVLTVSFVLSPVTMLGCHRRLRFTRQLDTSVGASGPHDFAVRIKRRSSLSASASTASRPALMTLRNAPLWDRTVSDILLIWGKREAEYFCKRGWTGFTDLPVG